jgi:hypothetical protein
LFIHHKIAADQALQTMKVIYFLYDHLDVLRQYSPDDATSVQTSSGSAGSTSTGATANSGVRPSPFNSSPMPNGAPKKWWNNEEDEKEK